MSQNFWIFLDYRMICYIFLLGKYWIFIPFCICWNNFFLTSNPYFYYLKPILYPDLPILYLFFFSIFGCWYSGRFMQWWEWPTIFSFPAPRTYWAWISKLHFTLASQNKATCAPFSLFSGEFVQHVSLDPEGLAGLQRRLPDWCSLWGTKHAGTSWACSPARAVAGRRRQAQRTGLHRKNVRCQGFGNLGS